MGEQPPLGPAKSDLLTRVAGAPITWGVDPAPGWGYQMHRDRVLGEMSSIGLAATELGPDGWLPAERGALDDVLENHRLRVVGGFVPAVLHRPELVADQLDYVDRASRTLAGAGAEIQVLGPASHLKGYDTSMELTDEEWPAFVDSLKKVIEIGDDNGVATALHPHWGMAIERLTHVERLLESSDVGLCIDTGHLVLAGADPLEVARLATTRRVLHVHLKDVDGAMAGQVRAGDLGFREAVGRGLFRPLGRGDADIAGLVGHLERDGFDGWYVLEQDAQLDDEPAIDAGPKAQARESLAFLECLATELPRSLDRRSE